MTEFLKQVSIGDIQLNVYDRGTGRTILFVHGFPLNHKMWEFQIATLADDYRVIVPDLRGFGESDTGTPQLKMRQFADDLNRLLDELQIDEPIAFCGLSMGGYIAWEFVREYSNRLQFLILCDTKAAADTEAGIEIRHKMAASVLKHGSEFAATAMPPKLFAASTIENQPHVTHSIREMILGTKPESIAAAQHGMAARSDSRSLLSKIQIPTLIIVGEDDAITTVDEMREMSEVIPNSRFVEIADAGHMAPMENPVTVNQAIRAFLKSESTLSR